MTMENGFSPTANWLALPLSISFPRGICFYILKSIDLLGAKAAAGNRTLAVQLGVLIIVSASGQLQHIVELHPVTILVTCIISGLGSIFRTVQHTGHQIKPLGNISRSIAV